MKEIIIGTIGTGNIVRQILNAVIPLENVYLGAVYSRSPEKADMLAGEYTEACSRYKNTGCSCNMKPVKTFDSLDEMLHCSDINTVYIASPNNMHYQHAKTALLAGKHVICEKPMCPFAEQVKELADLAQNRHLMLIDATPTSYLPDYNVVCEDLSSIGNIRLVMCNYSQYSSRYDRLLQGEVTNVFDPAFAGGALMDIGYYNIYLAAALFGMPEDAQYFPNICATGVDTSGIAILKYPGFVFEGTNAKDTWGVNYFQIEGEKGYIYIENGSNGLGVVRTVTKNGTRETDLQENTYFSEGWGIKVAEPFNRWHYEMQGISRMLLNEDHAENKKRLKTTENAIKLLETLRKRSGVSCILA